MVLEILKRLLHPDVVELLPGVIIYNLISVIDIVYLSYFCFKLLQKEINDYIG